MVCSVYFTVLDTMLYSNGLFIPRNLIVVFGTPTIGRVHFAGEVVSVTLLDHYTYRGEYVTDTSNVSLITSLDADCFDSLILNRVHCLR